MVDLEQLKTRGLRAYEWARLRMALRAAVFLVPAFLGCWLVGDRELCACLMPLLAGAVLWLRWRDRRGVEDVTIGLTAGAIPLVAGLLLSSLRTTCGGPMCLAISAGAGVAAGLLVAKGRQTTGLSSWFAATAIAAVAAVLGCSALGVFGILGVVAGVVAGSGLGAALPAR
jgi:hypothetical protein